MRLFLVILCLGLFAVNQTAYAGGCNAACYAQKNAAKQRLLAANRHQARIAHNKAIAVQKARRAAANRQRARAAQVRANSLRKQRQLALARQRAAAARNKAQPRRHHHRPRQQARRHHQPRRNHRRLTPQQQLAALLVLQQRNRNYNIASRAYQNSMNNMSYRIRRQSAIHSCQYTGTCRVVTRRLY